MNIEEELSDQLASEMAKEIDFGIISTILIESGWTKVVVDRFTDNRNAVDIADWAEANCKGKHIKYAREYVFELKADAEWFTLVWC